MGEPMATDRSALAAMNTASARIDGVCNRLCRLAADLGQLRQYVEPDARALFDARVKSILDAVEDLGMKT